MKISRITAYPLSAPLARPLYTAHEALRESSVVLVEAVAGDIRGYGIVHAAPVKTVSEWVARLGEVVIGSDALAHEVVWDRMFSLTTPRPSGMFGADGLPPPLPRGARAHIMAALGGIDIALWDIKGKAAGMPVYRLLGGENRPLRTYSTGGYYSPQATLDGLAREMAGYVEVGFRAVKLKSGGLSLEEEVRRVATVREAIGPDVGLMLDLNAAYGLERCIAYAHAVAPYDITWLEEPLHWHLQPADYVRLSRATDIPLAHGERELHRYTVRDFVTSGAIRFLQFDGTRAAGFTEAIRVAQLAEQHGVCVAPHHAPEIHGHLVAALPQAGYCVESHGNAERDPLAHELYTERAEFRDGCVHLSDRPGFGLDIDWSAVARYEVK